jgi:hypothetical protein
MRFWRTLRAVLREIFEEAAFDRYCARKGLAPSREAYAGFIRDARLPKARCC